MPPYHDRVEGASRTEEEYVAAISNVLAYVQSHLDEALSPGKLAQVACFSQHHFHRIFRAAVGESVMDHVRRLRLERAAYRLKTGQESVASIAFDAGYGAQEAFTRVFQAHYGLPPRTYRRAHAAHRLPSPSGIHYGPGGFTSLRRAVEPESLDSDCLCEVHRRFPAEFEARWEEALSVLTGYSSFFYPPPSRGPSPQPFEADMTENQTDIDREIEAIQNEIETAKQRLIEARRRRPKEAIGDYVLKSTDGAEVRLSELFGDKDDLILVHN
ncbi:helix-turn-helix domain-containing protein, partial [bacterium]